MEDLELVSQIGILFFGFKLKQSFNSANGFMDKYVTNGFAHLIITFLGLVPSTNHELKKERFF